MTSRRRRICIAFIAATMVASAAPSVGADESGADPEHEPDAKPERKRHPDRPIRAHDATWKKIFAGPFHSSRLFAMPTAEVVGAFQMSLSGDASLLSEPGVLSASTVIAMGYGDIAQLEYRTSNAITTVDNRPFRLPSVGVQLKAPFARRKYVPSFAVALRFGFPRSESVGTVTHDEQATDLYFVGSLRLWGPFERFHLHGGLRVSSATIDSEGEPLLEDASRTLFLPAGGWDVQMTDHTVLAGELALVPLFDPGDATRPSEIRSGVFGRAGVRWHLLPSVVLDASIGYRIEVERLAGSPRGMINSLVDWDIRLGGEIFLPWGAAVCKTVRVFCD